MGVCSYYWRANKRIDHCFAEFYIKSNVATSAASHSSVSHKNGRFAHLCSSGADGASAVSVCTFERVCCFLAAVTAVISDSCRRDERFSTAGLFLSLPRSGECGELHHAACCLPAQVRGGGRETGLRGRRGRPRLFCVRAASCGWLAAFPLRGVMFSARLGPSVLPPLVLHSRCCSGCSRKHDAGAPPAPTHSSR